ncbi:MAG TPA: hypothetical protein VKM55_17205, partial [Candidatus Lokiarchaeia archaeon]|nr:hypothetical protein [Candidatus Lokiarchaeia archaeon]
KKLPRECGDARRVFGARARCRETCPPGSWRRGRPQGLLLTRQISGLFSRRSNTLASIRRGYSFTGLPCHAKAPGHAFCTMLHAPFTSA